MKNDLKFVILGRTPKVQIVSFFKLVVEGIRGEYKKGWSSRNDKKDIKTLRELLTKI